MTSDVSKHIQAYHLPPSSTQTDHNILSCLARYEDHKFKWLVCKFRLSKSCCLSNKHWQPATAHGHLLEQNYFIASLAFSVYFCAFTAESRNAYLSL